MLKQLVHILSALVVSVIWIKYCFHYVDIINSLQLLECNKVNYIPKKPLSSATNMHQQLMASPVNKGYVYYQNLGMKKSLVKLSGLVEFWTKMVTGCLRRSNKCSLFWLQGNLHLTSLNLRGTYSVLDPLAVLHLENRLYV